MHFGYPENYPSFLVKNIIKRSEKRNPKLLLSGDFASETITYTNNMIIFQNKPYIYEFLIELAYHPILCKSAAVCHLCITNCFHSQTFWKKSLCLSSLHSDFHPSFNICFLGNFSLMIPGTLLYKDSDLSLKTTFPQSSLFPFLFLVFTGE